MIRIMRCKNMTSTEEKDIWQECGAGLSEEKEMEIFLALRKALLDYPKLINTFGRK